VKDWEQTLVAPDAPLRDAMAVIDRAGVKIALVVDPARTLLGTLTDGDARRALLRGVGLDQPVREAMHRGPATARASEGRASILEKIRRLGLHQIPVVDEAGQVVGLETVDDFLSLPTRPNMVVIMAGGRGTRLKELTDATPKPMLKVGSKPILETIVESFVAQGFRRIVISVNYRADQIEAHFADGRTFGAAISYLREPKRLGTAGALGLIDQRPDEPIVVTNADLLTREDFGRMLDEHQQSGAVATMAVREYEMQVPFGVVSVDDGRISGIEEKPVQRYLVSAGMYVLSPQALDHVPANTYLDMPTLFSSLIAAGLKTRCHDVTGYWLDIGRPPDLERAKADYGDVFQ